MKMYYLLAVWGVMTVKLKDVKVPALNSLEKAYEDVADVVAEAKDVDELYRRLKDLGFRVDYDVLKAHTEEFDGGLIGTDEVLFHVFRNLGFATFKLGRAVAVATSATVVHSVEVEDKKVLKVKGKEPAPIKDGKLELRNPGLAVVVFGDPDSGLRYVDVVVVTGYRFGVNDIILNGQTLRTVHGDSDDVLTNCLRTAKVELAARLVPSGDEKVLRALDHLVEVARLLGVEEF